MNENNDLNDLKRRGFIKQRQDGFFVLKVRMPSAGFFSSLQIAKLASISERYSKGIMHLTVRQGVEIPFIKYEDIPEVEREVISSGISTGASGPRLRPITACPGNNWCKFGVVNTFNFATRVENELGLKCGMDLPHKFKIAISGCPNGCTRPQVTEVGVIGGITGYSIYLGGCGGKTPMAGIRIDKILSEDEALEVIKRTMQFFKSHAKARQRLGALIVEFGKDEFLKLVSP